MDLKRSVQFALVGGAILACTTLISVLTWLLLAELGDERGAELAWLISVSGGMGLIGVQILLINLLALGTLGVKMETIHRSTWR